MFGCQHSSSLVSINGWYHCQRCFRLVRHPWVTDHIAEAGRMVPTIRNFRTVQSGIERVQREEESADKKFLQQMRISR